MSTEGRVTSVEIRGDKGALLKPHRWEKVAGAVGVSEAGGAGGGGCARGVRGH